MSNKIQIKRSVANAVVTGLANGEMAYTNAGDILYIGSPNGNGTIAIGGIRAPGVLTANHALVANSASGIDKIITANLTTQELYANGAAGSDGYVLVSGGAGANIYWKASAGTNTDAQFTWTNTHTFYANLYANAVYANSYNTGSGYGTTTGGVVANNTAVAVGNSSINAVITSNATVVYFTGTAYSANDSLNLNGKSESALNVNNALTANDASNLNGKSEGNLNVNSATSAVNANNATYVGSNTVGDIVTLAVANTLSNNGTYTGNNIFQGNTDFQGLIANNFIPSANATYSLGNSSLRWANLYLSGSTINLGNNTISDTANGITVTNFEATANAIIANLQVGYITSNATPGTNTTFYLGTSSNWWANAFIGGITGNTAGFSGDLTVGGNLTVHGNVTTTDVQSVIVSDPLIFLAGNNITSDTLDIGFAGQYFDGADQRWTGLFRDHADNGIYKLFTHTTQDLLSNNDIDTSDGQYQVATLQAYLTSGGLTSNGSSIYVTANSTVNVNIVANTLTLTTPLNANSGGTGQSSYANGDLLYASGTYAVGKLAVGANGDVLQIVNNLPAYGTLDGGTF
jgi:hypothetical protein